MSKNLFNLLRLTIVAFILYCLYRCVIAFPN